MSRGFTPDEWQEIRGEGLSFLQNAATTLAPFGSLSANVLAHLREDWITFREDHIRINIPPEAPCNTHKLDSSNSETNMPMLKKREKPCSYCLDEGRTNGFENLWKDNNEPLAQRHTTILNRKLAKPAVDVLEKVFNVYARPELAATPRGITSATDRLREDGVMPDTSSYTTLKRTGPVLYCYYGLNKDEIANTTQYESQTVADIVAATPGITFDEITTRGLLNMVDEMEPVTAKALANRLDYQVSGIRHRLNRLKKEGRVKVSNNHKGPPASTWSTTENWMSQFQCNECDFESHSLQSVRVHERKSH
jgi:ribosomal protein S25